MLHVGHGIATLIGYVSPEALTDSSSLCVCYAVTHVTGESMVFVKGQWADALGLVENLNFSEDQPQILKALHCSGPEEHHGILAATV